MYDKVDVRRAERLENTDSGSNRALPSSPVWSSHIGEVARSDGGVRCDKVRLGNGKRFLYRRLVNDPFAPMTFR